MLKFLKEMICLMRGHRWGPTYTYTEEWHTFEDITDNGGLTLGLARGKPQGDDEEGFTRTYEGSQCTFCKYVNEEEKY